jgi:hypothetical protein
VKLNARRRLNVRLGADLRKQMLTALILLCSIGMSDCGQIAEAPDQTELPFMCLQYGMEEVAKHPVPEGKYVKVQCVPKSVPRIIE